VQERLRRSGAGVKVIPGNAKLPGGGKRGLEGVGRGERLINRRRLV